MTTSTAPGRGWTVMLRRQGARTAGDQPSGRYTNNFEIICRECGDDLGCDYQDAEPQLQRIRGPYLIEEGVTEYQAHIAWHEAQVLL